MKYYAGLRTIVRIREILRLKERSVPSSLVKEHISGLEDVISTYSKELRKIRLSNSKKIKFREWKNQYFPEFKEINIKDLYKN